MLSFACSDGRRRALRWQAVWRLLLMLLLLGVVSMSLNVQARLLSEPRVDLAGDIEVLRDPAGQWGVGDMLRPDIARGFARLTGQASLGYVQGSVWLRITLERPATAASRWWLGVGAPLVDDVRLYSPTAAGGFVEQHSGVSWPFGERAIGYRSPMFAIDLAAATPTTLYLRVTSHNAMALQLTVWTPEAFAVQLEGEYLVLGLYLAIHFAVLLSCIWNFRATRERFYFYLAAFAFFSMGTTAASEGLLFQYLMPQNSQWLDPVMLVFWFQGLPLYSMFMLEALKIAWHQGIWRVYIWLQWSVSALALLLALAWDFQQVLPAYMILALVCTVLNFGVLILGRAKGKPEARWLLFGATVLNVGLGMRFGRNMGWLQSTVATENFYLIGLITHQLVMSYVASCRYRDIHHANQEAQAQALRISMEATRILEARVLARTLALQQALTLVESSLDVERRATADQQRFFSTVSHELRTPLAVIDATTHNLELDGQNQNKATRQRYEKIKNASEQLATLVKNCFHEDRFDVLKRGIFILPTDLHEMLFDVRQSALLQSPKHEVLIDAELPEVFGCDPEKTSLILLTLVGNAVRYTPPGSKLVLRGRTNEQGVTLEVIDNGPGVSSNDLPHLFERYFRGQGANLTSGTGLGLPLARELAEMQGGSLTVSSVVVQGFCATLCLPVNDKSVGRQMRDESVQGKARRLARES